MKNKVIFTTIALVLIFGGYYYFTKQRPFNIDDLVIIGLCPDEVIQKLGDPYFYHAQIDYTKWEKNTDPQLVIMKQCQEADKSTFELYFDKGEKYMISFENGKAVDIEIVKK